MDNFQAKKCGWGGRIRTSECRNQNPVSYRLTTPQNGRCRIHNASIILTPRPLAPINLNSKILYPVFDIPYPG